MSYPAESYERYMVPALFGPWASYLMRAARAQPGERVLDVACGTGVVARRIAPYVEPQGRVTGLDINAERLSVARAAAEREGLAIEWRLGQAEKLPFPDDSFDVIVCQFGLMLFDDPHVALTEMRRTLSANGRAALSVWQGLERHPFYQALDDMSQRRLGRSSVGGMFSLGDPAELRGLLEGAGFQQVEIESVSMAASFPDPDEFLAWEASVDPDATPALRHLGDTERREILAALRQDLRAALREAAQGDQMALPFHAHIARARR
jgi:ubiquinone/menaquinone biosynthesis C-methylase UbiE